VMGPVLTQLLVTSAGSRSQGLLEYGPRSARCALGRSGISPRKREGDGATPSGRLSLRKVFYRPDRLPPPLTALPLAPLQPDDGWCDDPADPLYNRPIKLPYPGRSEIMWRTDSLYDILVVLGHNDNPVVPGKGSAIFMHLAAADYAPTAGCVAVSLEDMTSILRHCGANSELVIRP
jgi:L,D-peptidoglycan transpeptidase YkuD (ErfK/YbiS/YcfS/YnhG family)